MPIEVGDIVLFSIYGQCFGQRILFTHHYRVTGSPNPAQPTSGALDDFLSALNVDGASPTINLYKACLPPDYECTAGRAQVIAPSRSAYKQTELYDGLGTYATGTESSNQTGVISLRTENAGRDQVSNKHIGPIPAAAQVNGLLSDAYQGILGSFADKLLQSVTPAGTALTYSPIIFHGGSPFTYDAVTNRIVNPTVRTQRRRTVGLGE
jgi:hypothetical protein